MKLKLKDKAKTIKEIAILSETQEVVYLAGKITGIPYEEAFKKFVRAEIKLTEAGFSVINPMVLVHQDAEWQDAMRICISFLPHADHICLLPDWNESKGATVERNLAMALGIGTIEL
ncbi:MAG: DUF4406 domain-containing protein [Daejeonella sp.]